MSVRLLAILLGALLMAEPKNDVTVEPGKQLPQSLTIQVGENDAKQTVTIRFLLFVPQAYETGKKEWPLIIFLHGHGECSDSDLDRVKTHGPPKLVESKADFPFVVVSPQCPPPGEELEMIKQAWKADELIQLVDHIVNELRIDKSRIYVTGLSMGGYGTWRLAATYPDRFAAAVPICGGGEPATAAKLRGMPIWCFHGAKDAVVPVADSQRMVDAVVNAGGKARLTVYADAEHDAWTRTYNNPELYEWLLSQEKRKL